MKTVLPIFVALLCALIALILLLRPGPQPTREVSIRTVRDTVVIVQVVERPVIRYRTVPRVVRDTLRESATEFIRMTHDTIVGGDTIRVVAEYPPPRLEVQIAPQPVRDTLRIMRTWLETTSQPVQRPNHWRTATWFLAGMASGIILKTVIR